MKMKTKTASTKVHKVLAAGAVATSLSILPCYAANIVTESFGGDDTDLNGTTADTFASGITSAGGSNTWAARPLAFQSDGDVVSVGGLDSTAYLDMGSYINDAKGTAAGLFTLSATLSPTTSGSWVSLGFFSSPATTNAFTATGLGSIIYRSTGELDMWGGVGTGTGAVDGPDAQTGDQLLTIVLDLTTHDNATDFGTVTWYQGTTGGTELGSYAYLADNSFDAIGMSSSHNTNGGVSGLTLDDLTAVPEPSSTALLGLGGIALLLRRRK